MSKSRKATENEYAKICLQAAEADAKFLNDIAAANGAPQLFNSVHLNINLDRVDVPWEELWNAPQGKATLLTISDEVQKGRLPSRKEFNFVTPPIAETSLREFLISLPASGQNDEMKERIENARMWAQLVEFRGWLLFYVDSCDDEDINDLWNYGHNNFPPMGVERENYPALLRQCIHEDTKGEVLYKFLRFFKKMRSALDNCNETPWDIYKRRNANCGRALNYDDQKRLKSETIGWRQRRDQAILLSRAFDELVISLNPKEYADRPTLQQMIESYQALLKQENPGADTTPKPESHESKKERGAVNQQSKPQNGKALTPEQQGFIRGAKNKKTSEIIDEFFQEFKFKICEKTVRNYRNR